MVKCFNATSQAHYNNLLTKDKKEHFLWSTPWQPKTASWQNNFRKAPQILNSIMWKRDSFSRNKKCWQLMLCWLAFITEVPFLSNSHMYQQWCKLQPGMVTIASVNTQSLILTDITIQCFRGLTKMAFKTTFNVCQDRKPSNYIPIQTLTYSRQDCIHVTVTQSLDLTGSNLARNKRCFNFPVPW